MWWIRKQLLRLKLYLYENYQNEAESLIVWYAVSLALGSAFYFALPYELSVGVIIGFFEAVLLLLYLTRRNEVQFKILTYLAVFMLGLSIAKADAMYRSNHIEKDLPEVIYLNGYVRNLDYNSNQRPRLHITNANNFDKELKGEFRISSSYIPDWLKAGKCVELVAKLPQKYTPNPIGNYNFERANFYKGISATGYNIGPIFEKDCIKTPNKTKSYIIKIRDYIKNIIQNNSPSDVGSIITALTIGDKSYISKELSDNYRTSGLAHFLAISGMHMGMIALLVFFLVRSTLFPLGAGRYDLRKPAAIISIIFTFAYFLISGQSISCIRAFVMTTIILLGVLLNRRAISLRLWAFAILIVTIITPEAVVSPGFLMSFSAVLGLVSFYENNASSLHNWFKTRSLIGKIATYLLGILITDLVATIMTMPYSLYYFQQVSIYTSIGNLLADPVIAFLVMPSLLLFLISIPLGLSSYCIIPLNYSIKLINKITAYVSSLPGAHTGESIGLMPDWGIFIITLGFLWLCIWQSKWRYWGVLLIILGLSSIATISRPDFVFDETGTTYAYRNSLNRLVPSQFHKNKFLTKIWTGNPKHERIDNTIKCDDEKCIYQNQIEFSKEKIIYKNKEISLNNGGYINIDKGLTYYKPEKNRLWNK